MKPVSTRPAHRTGADRARWAQYLADVVCELTERRLPVDAAVLHGSPHPAGTVVFAVTIDSSTRRGQPLSAHWDLDDGWTLATGRPDDPADRHHARLRGRSTPGEVAEFVARRAGASHGRGCSTKSYRVSAHARSEVPPSGVGPGSRGSNATISSRLVPNTTSLSR